jgi:uncharacterized protein with PQ loop repeat
MPPQPASLTVPSHRSRLVRRVIGSLSVFTMVMTIPQVWAVWSGRQVSGVSLTSWGAYLLSAVLWLWYGLQRRDKNIYLPCVGWIAMDAAVIEGVLLHR